MRQLDRAVAVVTGAGSGIGRATAQALAARGCALAIADIDEAGLQDTADSIHGVHVSTHLVDVANKQRMRAFADEVMAEQGRVNVVVNNAGVTVTSSFEHHSLEDFEWLFGVNMWGVIYGCKFFLPHLQASGWGCFVNLSSLFGLTGVPLQTSYCASKFAVRGFSEALAIELANENIDVINVHPGGIRTNIVRNSRSRPGRAHERTIALFDRFGMAPERAADQIVDGIERRRQRVVITAEARVADVVKRVYPAIPRRLVGWALRRSSWLEP